MQQIDNEKFSLELYKELKSEEQFFKHYLDLSLRRKTEQINKGLQYFQDGLFPLNDESSDKFFELEQQESAELASLEDEKKLSEKEMEDVIR